MEAPVLDEAPPKRSFVASIEDASTRQQIEMLGDFHYDYKQLFIKTHGWGARKDVKKRVRILQGLETRFAQLLYPEERVEYVTHGTFYSFAEQYFMGIFSILINRTVFVFTSHRILMFNSDGKQRPKQQMWQIPYDHIAKFIPGSMLSTTVVFKLQDRSKFKFTNIPKIDRKSLREYVNRMMALSVTDAEEEESISQSCDPLCPACFTPALKSSGQCGQCEEPFIAPLKPALMSALLPCLGDLYLGHYLLAGVELFGYIITWVVLINMYFEKGASIIPYAAVVLAIAHLFDAFITYKVANKGKMLVRLAWSAS